MPGAATDVSYDQCLAILDRFLGMLDHDHWQAEAQHGSLVHIRRTVLGVLKTLLVWHRPALAQDRGIAWPYEALRQRAARLEALAKDHPQAGIRTQAHLFLALLPFPGQWRWLLAAERTLPDHPELRAFLDAEAHRIKNKWAGKKQRAFRLRHFCQILLRPRSHTHKGILRIFALPYLMASPALVQAIARDYVLFVEPPSGIVFRHPWLRVFCTLPQPTLFGMGSAEDRSFLDSQPNIVTTHLAHGEFLPPAPPVPPAGPQRYDFVFNGTFDGRPGKRHSLMLDLMRHPLLAHRTVLFLGRGRPASVAEFKQEIEDKGLGPRATIVDNIQRAAVPAYLRQCRVGVHLSLYENVCRSVFEFWRADLPCVTSTAMAGTRWDRFNSATGMVVCDRDLPYALARMLRFRHHFRPGRWFSRTTGSHHATGQLQGICKAVFDRLGFDWQADLFELSSSGANRYANPADYARCRRDYQRLQETFQDHLPQDLRGVLD